MLDAFVTHPLGHGADVRAALQLHGHADIPTTTTSTHVTRERLRQRHAARDPRG